MTTSEKKPVVIGVDDGHAEIKLAWVVGGAIKTLSIPSLAQQGAVGLTGGQGAPVGVYTTDDVQYTVHPSVPNPSDTRSHEYYASGLNRVLVHHALVQAGFGGKDVHLVTGLPPGRFYDFSAESGKSDVVIDKKRKSLMKPVAARGEVELARVVKHTVVPEAVAAVYDYVLELDGSDAETVTGRIGVIDIGGRTTDVAAILPDDKQGFVVDQSATASFDTGVLKLGDRIRGRVVSAHNVESLDSFSMRSVIATRQVELFGELTDISAIVDQSCAEVAGQIIEQVKVKLGDGSRYQRILLIGGGAHALSAVVREYGRNGAVPEDPQFANARGMLKVGLNY